MIPACLALPPFRDWLLRPRMSAAFYARIDKPQPLKIEV